MRSFVPLRLASQLCLYAAAVCLFAPFRADWPMFALLPVLAFAAALAAGRCRSAGLRLLLGLAPALALPLASGWLSLAGAALAIGYTAAVLTAGRFVQELWQYRRETVALIPICAVICLFSVLAAFRSPPTRGFAVACVVLAFLALRALRMRQAASPAWEAGSPVLFVLPLAGAAALGAALWASVPLLQYAVRGLGALLAGLLSLWNKGWTWLMRYAEGMSDDFYVEETAVPAEWYGEATQAADAGQSGTTFRIPDLHIPWTLLLAVAAGVVLLILLIRFLRRGRRVPAGEAPEEFVYEKLPVEAAPVRSRRRRRTARTNRGQIRQIYREYLSYLRIHGIPHRASETTADVTDSARPLLIETDEVLRDLYRKARYSSAELSPEELQTAKERLSRLTADANLQRPQ